MARPRKPRDAVPLTASSEMTAKERTAIEDGLYAFNMQATGVRDGRLLSIALRDDRGRMRGGLFGHTWGGCLTVTALWVHPRFRARGYGTLLMTMAEAVGRKRRCKASVLSTHSFQARPFYERLGYRVVARMKDYPYGHSQVWMRKRLPPLRAARV